MEQLGLQPLKPLFVTQSLGLCTFTKDMQGPTCHMVPPITWLLLGRMAMKLDVPTHHMEGRPAEALAFHLPATRPHLPPSLRVLWARTEKSVFLLGQHTSPHSSSPICLLMSWALLTLGSSFFPSEGMQGSSSGHRFWSLTLGPVQLCSEGCGSVRMSPFFSVIQFSHF